MTAASQKPIETIPLQEIEPELHQTEIQRLADRLAGISAQVSFQTPSRSLLAELQVVYERLTAFHAHFQHASVEELSLSYASEWVLDNFYIIRQAAQQIKEDLPPGYLLQLPRLTQSPLQGYPRIYMICRAYLISSQFQVNIDTLEDLLRLLQEKVPLTIGELWAVPIFLRFVLLDALAQALSAILPNVSQPPLTSLPIDFEIAADEVVATTVTGLRHLADQDWKAIFEDVNLIDRILAQDPIRTYEKMDFETRNHYRSVVEQLAKGSRFAEHEVASAALKMAQQAVAADPALMISSSQDWDARSAHVGYYLVSDGRQQLEQQLHYRPDPREFLGRWVQARPLLFYLGLIGLLALLFVAGVGYLTAAAADHAWQPILAVVLSLIPALTAATNLANWLFTSLRAPTTLAKLELKEGIPDNLKTLIAVPALFSSSGEVESLIRQLELHLLRNPSANLIYAILSDFSDADAETLPQDEELIAKATAGVELLNQRYRRPDGSGPFYLLHRKRMWNPSEGKWIGWERKRGKLQELNHLLRGAQGLSFSHVVGDASALRSVRFVITLDADTILPNGSASRLIGTLAHPLNRAVFRRDTNKMIAGYSILQPRVEISPSSANRSLFSQIWAGDSGLDLYSLAVSDVYQDTFGEGIYVGKGIYDVDAFERSIAGQIPENSLLSHDLFEGLLGRAGLVTDITVIEDYPDNYFAHVRRLHRWIRGDWQLLPWLLHPRQLHNNLQAIDRWKIFDNLRRSLVAPALMLLFLFAWVFLPGSPWLWFAVGSLPVGVPFFTSLYNNTRQAIFERTSSPTFRPAGLDLLRWVLAIVFMPFEAMNAVDAIGVTLYRLVFSRRHLLEWTTAASTARMLKNFQPLVIAWAEMALSLFWVTGFGVLLAFLRLLALPFVAPLLLVWLSAPVVAVRLNRLIARRSEILTQAEIERLRKIARRTWAFFEQFAGPEDHWLPPDHFQESPVGQVAHRTSPTNIGLLLTSTLGAYELGYIDQFALASRLQATFETLESMPRYRGHFLNWIDTRSLQPLNPRYVSTVDSGNLAACLILTEQSMLDIHSSRLFRRQRWEGILDTLNLLNETLDEIYSITHSQVINQIRQTLKDTKAQIRDALPRPERWYPLFIQTSGQTWQEITTRLSTFIEDNEAALSPAFLRQISQAVYQVEQHFTGVKRTIQDLVPWIPLLENSPAVFTQGELAAIHNQLHQLLPYSPVFAQIPGHTSQAAELIVQLRALSSELREGPEKSNALLWLDSLTEALQRSEVHVTNLLAHYALVAKKARQLVAEMDFQFLYDRQQRIFSIGYNLDAARLDPNYYDLLASEARITSLIAISKGDVPPEHWLYLNRPVTNVDGRRVLLSWSATMFEYLMPPLFMRTYPGTLLEQSALGAVQRQINYGREKNVPWGISESGFYRFDANQSYQYRAFGVPGLGFKRGLSDDLVIAPYASLMAVGFQSREVLQNAERLEKLGMMGRFGFYEAIDFTESRMAIGSDYQIVHSYMAHHQGMILLALVNFLKDDLFVRRMHAEPRIRSVELLLQEQIPFGSPLQDPEAEMVAGTQRLVTEAIEIRPWTVPISTPIPQIHLLSNGQLSELITQVGSGYLRWQNTDLTRWQPDAVADRSGIWIYVRDLDQPREQPWSVTHQPIPSPSGSPITSFHSHMAVFQRTENEITSSLEVTLSNDSPVEIRRLHLTNPTNKRRHLRLDSYGEVILTDQANDARHPAFNKLFIQSEYVPDHNLLLFRRRPRSASEAPIFLGHALIVEEGDLSGFYETDRKAFLGRRRDVSAPVRLRTSWPYRGMVGSTLDPIFSLGQEIILEPHSNARLVWLTMAADSREEILELAERYRNWNFIERAFHQSHISAEISLRKREVDTDKLKLILQLLSAAIYPLPAMRSAPEIRMANRKGQAGLWPFGISGDYPILLVQVSDPQRLELVREAIQAHRYGRERGLKIDLVILNQQRTDYGAEMNRLLYRLIARTNSDNWLHQRGGIYVLHADQMNLEEHTLLLSASRVVLDDAKGTLEDQVVGYSVPVPHLPAFAPSRSLEDRRELTPALGPITDLSYANGFGGFSADGSEYVIESRLSKPTPLPWVNVIGYPDFGFLITEAGSSNTWAGNSGENRLTPWSNDPVSDWTGEALYLRDEETGDIWSPTPLPAGDEHAYRTRHGIGYTTFEHNSHGLRQSLSVFADPQDPVKIIRLKIENTWQRPRRITATQYIEWVLGTLRPASEWFIQPEFRPDLQALLATNPYNSEFADRVAFLATPQNIHGFTADRMEFIGRNGSLKSPIGLTRIGLEGRVAPGEHPCAVLQVHIDLEPGQSDEVMFILGQGDNREHSIALIEKYTKSQACEESLQRVHDFWKPLLTAIQVKTPDPAMDLMLNQWMLYQTLSCRIWGRSGFFQSSGAYGFRDQLQDVLAVLPIQPEIARQQIRNAARHQFDAGDVLHWWHPPSGRGVRTRISDDLLWLPYVVAEFVRVTGDDGILQDQEPFLIGAPLQEGEEERYGHYSRSNETYSIFEHCRRALEKGTTRGVHGLPLMGTGDWNDGMNRVGVEGEGESVWLAWFLYETLQRFAWLCDMTGSSGSADAYRRQADELREAIEASAWDGEWYLRAFYDDGSPLGSHRNRECQIDSIAQSWGVLSGAASSERAVQSMSAVSNRLVRPADRLIQLFAPPFDTTPRDPGYIKGYVPGIRENGGQYTHAATWAAWAFTRLGEGNTAAHLYQLLNPIYQAVTQKQAEVYQVEPYVIAADVYSTPPHVRRGGWTWYTGSGGWMYRLGIEAILGVRREGNRLIIDPVIPAEWPGFEVRMQYGNSTYHIRVSNPNAVQRGIAEIRLDGKILNEQHILLQQEGSTHQVDVVMGSTRG